jgi:hypothetical protein
MHTEIAHNEWISKAELKAESGESWVLDYYLQKFNGSEGKQCYGLRVEKSSLEGELLEHEETRAITENREAALAMTEAFAKGSVPPVTLLEMADEWLSEYSETFVEPSILLPV